MHPRNEQNSTEKGLTNLSQVIQSGGIYSGLFEVDTTAIDHLIDDILVY